IQNEMGMSSELFSQVQRKVFEKVAKNSIVTSSFGRLLDAVSCALDVCCERTYEGEPAMKLEGLQMRGSFTREYDVYTKNGVVQTLEGFIQMMEDDAKREDKAASYVSQVSEEIARSAITAAEDEGTKNIGISGGVSYNRPIVETVRSTLRENGYDLYVHEKIPNGDMGIPLGQAYICAHLCRD
ncbi:MAG: carbamoyltransferase HypF, partial [Thermoplasmatota archaeon]